MPAAAATAARPGLRRKPRRCYPRSRTVQPPSISIPNLAISRPFPRARLGSIGTPLALSKSAHPGSGARTSLGRRSSNTKTTTLLHRPSQSRSARRSQIETPQRALISQPERGDRKGQQPRHHPTQQLRRCHGRLAGPKVRPGEKPGAFDCLLLYLDQCAFISLTISFASMEDG